MGDLENELALLLGEMPEEPNHFNPTLGEIIGSEPMPNLGEMPFGEMSFGEMSFGEMLIPPNHFNPTFGEIIGSEPVPDLSGSCFNPTFEEIFGREKKVRRPHKLPKLSETEKESWEMLKAMIFTIIEEMKTNPESAPLVRRIDKSFKQIMGSNDTFRHWFNRRLRHYKLNSSKERVNQKKVSIKFLNDLYKYIEQRLQKL
jgi:hypothetical protein